MAQVPRHSSSSGVRLAAKLHRRSVLKGLGASALLSPFVNPVAASAAATVRDPDNLLLITWPCGLDPAWLPIGTGNDYRLASLRAPPAGSDMPPNPYATEPLLQTLVERHRSRLLVCSGMRSGVTDPQFCHSQGPTSMWSGWGGARTNEEAICPFMSIDQEIAQAITRGRAIASLHAGVLINAGLQQPDGSTFGRQFYHFGAGDPKQPQGPLALYDQITGSARARAVDRSILDFIQADIGRLQTDVSSQDRPRLEKHLDAIRSLEGSLALLPNGGSCAPPAPPDSGLVAADNDGSGVSAADLTQLQARLLALAFQCGVTKVATLQLGRSDCRYTAPYPGATLTVHQSAHSRLADPAAAAQSRYVTSRYMMDQLSAILDVLAATPVGRTNESLLDKTLVVMSSEMSGLDHGTSNIPVFIAGGSNTRFGFRFGEHVATRGEPVITRLLVTIKRYFGFEEDQILVPDAIDIDNARGVLTDIFDPVP
jgi:hypothetical protein